MISGLSHMTFVVRDLEEARRLFVDILGGREIYSSGDARFSLSREIFFDVGGLWVVAMEGEPLAERTYNHVAFKIEDGDFDACLERLTAGGYDIRPPRPRVEGEGRSIYFHDRDNHLFELHTGTLDERLARYARGPEMAE